MVLLLQANKQLFAWKNEPAQVKEKINTNRGEREREREREYYRFQKTSKTKPNEFKMSHTQAETGSHSYHYLIFPNKIKSILPSKGSEIKKEGK